ncbi:hypothetical protein [Halorussus amylolyticus]|uniref:hypothetical protein n=1 Tax=Halorussus amylolyticus TaxID=1126242 RepID=UPI00104405FC|nr:hypothetical protein [Halorussus amylolyticus]
MARDWSSLVLLVVGLVLVTSPFWLFADAGEDPHEGERVYAHEAAEIEYSEGVRGYIRADGEIERLDCQYYDSKAGCLFAAHVAQHGPVVVNVTDFYYPYDSGAEYVVVGDSDSEKHFYRRVVERGEGTVSYSLEAVAPETLLADIAVNESDLSPKAARTLDGETVQTHGRPLPDAGEVVRSDDGYYLIYESGGWDADPNTFDAKFYRAVAFLVGLGTLRWQWRGDGPAER